jgi:hypothetical protein
MRFRPSISFFLVAGVLALWSLATAQQPKDENQSKELKSIVFIGRLKDFGTRNYRPSVYVDDEQLARSQNGRYLAAKIDPGKHRVRAEDPKYSVLMDLKPGECYYFRVDLATGFWKSQGRLVSVTPEQGVLDLKRLEPIDSSHVKDNSRVVDAAQATALAATCAAKLKNETPASGAPPAPTSPPGAGATPTPPRMISN